VVTLRRCEISESVEQVCSADGNQYLERTIISYFPLQNVSVTQNMSSGVILSTHSLVLQGVTRHNSGSYTCLASNSRGETASKPVNLRVQCKYKASFF
jgi:hypothetical protein